MSIQFKSYSMLTEKKYDQDWYEWCVFVDGDKATVNRIATVEYKLHPTFSNPTRLIKDKEHRFALLSSGWGGFVIKVHVILENNDEEFSSFSLRLNEEDWPTKAPPGNFESPEAESVYGILTQGKFRWRKLRTIVERTGIPEPKVEEVLGKLQEGEFVRKLPYQSIDQQTLWAATSIVGVLPRL